jgi:hypothetical protein
MYKIGDLELSEANGFYITDPLEFPSTGKFDESSIWRGQQVYVSNISRNALKGKISGKTASRLAISNLLYYDVNNYDWNYDTEDIYLVEDSTRQWKLKMISIATSPLVSEYFEFDINLVVEDPSSEGITLKTSTGSIVSSPTNITGLTNSGDKNANFETLQIDGVYYGASNAKNIRFQHNLSTYVFNISNEILDGASVFFYPKINKSNFIYEDFFASTNLWEHNRTSYSGVTFSTDKLIFGNSHYLVFKFDLLHPLQYDPILTLSIINLSGSPKIQVSKDNIYYWDIDHNLENGTSIEYTLTKLSGNSTFYVKIYCGAADAFELSYMKLNSWHSISGQQPYITVLANALNDILICTLTAGQINYILSWRDKYNY